MAHHVDLLDDAFKAIFKFLPRIELRRLALTNGKFTDLLVPMMKMVNQKLIIRIPLTLENYRRLLDTDLPASIERGNAEVSRLKTMELRGKRQFFEAVSYENFIIAMEKGEELRGELQLVYRQIKHDYEERSKYRAAYNQLEEELKELMRYQDSK